MYSIVFEYMQHIILVVVACVTQICVSVGFNYYSWDQEKMNLI